MVLFRDEDADFSDSNAPKCWVCHGKVVNPWWIQAHHYKFLLTMVLGTSWHSERTREKQHSPTHTHSSLHQFILPTSSCFCLSFFLSFRLSWYFEGDTLFISIIRSIIKVILTFTDSTGNICQHLPTDPPTNSLSTATLSVIDRKARQTPTGI